MEQIEDWCCRASDCLDEFASTNEAVQRLADTLNIPGKTLVRYVTGAVLVIALMYSVQRIAVDFICLIIPLHMSLKAIVHKDKRASDLCLNYWAIYAVFNFLEGTFSMFLWVVPLWPVIKCFLLFSVYCPQIDAGSRIMHVIGPVWKNHEGYLDELLKRMPGGFAELVASHNAKKDDSVMQKAMSYEELESSRPSDDWDDIQLPTRKSN